MLVVFGGLPGTGKTTIARALAARRSAIYLRVDEIEQAIRRSGVPSTFLGASGYAVAQALAVSNLLNGIPAIADCVNPLEESREGWRAAATQARRPLLEIELVCSDPSEHRRRIERRQSDIAGLSLPDWEAVLARHYSAWREPHLVLDTATLTPTEALDIIARHMDATAS